MTFFKNTVILTILSRIRSHGRRFELGQTGVFLLIYFILTTVVLLY